MRILITGAKGQLGRVLVTNLKATHELTDVDIDTLDVTDLDAVMQMGASVRPEMVIHAAALTNVDYCAENPDDALRINGYGTRNVALMCQQHDIPLMYVSTNEVFDGTNTGVYLEYDATHAINSYGYSKLVGEQIVRDLLQKFYIVRTSWLFGHGGRNFIHAILERARANKPLRVVVNEVSTPTYVNDFAAGMVQLLGTERYGIYHLVNEGRASRYDFARYVLDIVGYADTTIERISSYEYPRASTPPEYAVLRNFAAAMDGIVLQPWQDAVRAFCIAEPTIEESVNV